MGDRIIGSMFSGGAWFYFVLKILFIAPDVPTLLNNLSNLISEILDSVNFSSAQNFVPKAHFISAYGFYIGLRAGTFTLWNRAFYTIIKHPVGHSC